MNSSIRLKKKTSNPSFFGIHSNGGLGANEGFASEIFKREFGHLHCCHGSLRPWTSLVSWWANKPHVLGGYQVRAASEWRMGQGMRVTVIWKICWKHPYHPWYPWDERYIYLHESHEHKRFMYIGKYTSPMDAVGHLTLTVGVGFKGFCCLMIVYFDPYLPFLEMILFDTYSSIGVETTN